MGNILGCGAKSDVATSSTEKKAVEGAEPKKEANTPVELAKEPDVIVWGMPPSANSSVVRAFLAASDLVVKEENAWGKTRTPEYIAKFPTNLTPAIECEGKYISECVVVLKFLCRAYPDKFGKYYPESDLVKVTTIDWICDYISTGVLAQLPKAVYPTLGFSLYAGDVGAMESTKQHTEEAAAAASACILEILETKYIGIFLANTKYLMSNEPTIADYRFAPMINFIKVACKVPKKLQQYYDEMEKLPGFKEACQPVVDFASPHWKKT